MRRFALMVLLSCLLLALPFMYKGGVSVVKASPDVYQGDLILNGGNVTIIEGGFEINGSVIVEENATLILRNAVLNLTQKMNYQHNITFQNPANGNPRFLVENATICSENSQRIYFYGNSTASINKLTAGTPSRNNIYIYDSSAIDISNSTLDFLYPCHNSTVNISHSVVSGTTIAYDNSSLNILNCTMSVVVANDMSAVNASHSTIDEVRPTGHSTNCSILGLKPGLMNYWNFEANCSIVGSRFPELALVNTLVGYWSFSFGGMSNIAVSDSELWDFRIDGTSIASIRDSLITDLLDSYDSAETSLINSTAAGYNINYESKVNVCWYLNVHVTDSIGQDVLGTNVTATYPSATIGESKLTGSHGWANLTLIEKVLNATGEYPVGNYNVEATYEAYSNSTTVNMTGNQLATLVFSELVIPEMLPTLIVPLFMVTMLFAIMVCRRERSRMDLSERE